MQNNCYGSEFPVPSCAVARQKPKQRKKPTQNVRACSDGIFFSCFFLAFFLSLEIRATGDWRLATGQSGRMPSSVSFSFQFPPNLPNWVKVLCHNQPGSRVRISNEWGSGPGPGPGPGPPFPSLPTKGAKE